MARPDYIDKIWVDSGRKLKGLCDEAAQARAGKRNVLIVAHFENTLAAVDSALRTRPIDHHTFFASDCQALCAKNQDSEEGKVWLALAPYLQSRGPSPSKEIGEERLCILFSEHHPMASKDEVLLDVITGLPCRSSIVFHTALTDGFMSHFGGEKLMGLLRQMGHDEDTYLSHPMVSAAIRRAQEKIDKQVNQEIRTLSEEEWFKYNIVDRR